MWVKKFLTVSFLMVFAFAADLLVSAPSHGGRSEDGLTQVLGEHRESRHESVREEQRRIGERGVSIGSRTVEDIFGHPPLSVHDERILDLGPMGEHRQARGESVERKQRQLAKRGPDLGTRMARDIFFSPSDH